MNGRTERSGTTAPTLPPVPLPVLGPEKSDVRGRAAIWRRKQKTSKDRTSSTGGTSTYTDRGQGWSEASKRPTFGRRYSRLSGAPIWGAGVLLRSTYSPVTPQH